MKMVNVKFAVADKNRSVETPQNEEI